VGVVRGKTWRTEAVRWLVDSLVRAARARRRGRARGWRQAEVHGAVIGDHENDAG
jgi:hypothetical protein